MPYISDGENIYSTYSTEGLELREARDKAHLERMQSDLAYRKEHDTTTNIMFFAVMAGVVVLGCVASFGLWLTRGSAH